MSFWYAVASSSESQTIQASFSVCVSVLPSSPHHLPQVGQSLGYRPGTPINQTTLGYIFAQFLVGTVGGSKWPWGICLYLVTLSSAPRMAGWRRRGFIGKPWKGTGAKQNWKDFCLSFSLEHIMSNHLHSFLLLKVSLNTKGYYFEESKKKSPSF